MHRFAQVQDGKAHWVFEADELFPHAPYVEIVDVTGIDPQVQEGWSYTGGIFSPPHAAPPPPPVTTRLGLVKSPELGYFGNVWVRKHQLSRAGDAHPGHKHNFDHVTFITKGRVSMVVEGIESIHQAPTFIEVSKDKEHYFTALEDDTQFWCVYAVRDDEGWNT